MSTPVAIRFDEGLLADVKRFAKRQDASVSTVVQRFTVEGLRMDEVPGIVFRSGPAGRRASIAGGPDVWEVIEAVREVTGNRDPARLAAELSYPERVISIALDYYGRYPEEIDEQIAENARQAESARAAWERRRSLA
jgi:hypothetical protein